MPYRTIAKWVVVAGASIIGVSSMLAHRSYPIDVLHHQDDSKLYTVQNHQTTFQSEPSQVLPSQSTGIVAAELTSSGNKNHIEQSATDSPWQKWTNWLPWKKQEVHFGPRSYVEVGGESIGIRLQSDGVLVIGFQDYGSRKSPARFTDLEIGDVIQSINGHPVHSTQDLTSQLIRPMFDIKLGIIHQKKSKTIHIHPYLDNHQRPHLGIFVRDKASGVGTLTYYNPAEHRLGALGHTITDVDTGQPIEGRGLVFAARITGIVKGQIGHPGQKRGEFSTHSHPIGKIDQNNGYGVFGECQPNGAIGPLLPVAYPNEVHTGEATLWTVLEGNKIEKFKVEVEKVSAWQTMQTKSLVLHVVDPRLLQATGGIVQGMSGSPLTQDGKLIGAVTHVFVSDPTRGYGVLATWMMHADGEDLQSKLTG
ncbi:SpoIVB peptidase [Alicyclobacillus tolerans]|uniref:Stage IV sporulation protein B n=1 Tax=Alicyclobacillus tolerans TaxID=90970 RepID=A0ABT9LWS6_9BACL|nr:SpoIVB peptidase [Alicyclobacillus tengchongensis]MDP9728725.1 stage IV sporulation protein B [Alicyclobacillus tengchongensis]